MRALYRSLPISCVSHSLISTAFPKYRSYRAECGAVKTLFAPCHRARWSTWGPAVIFCFLSLVVLAARDQHKGRNYPRACRFCQRLVRLFAVQTTLGRSTCGKMIELRQTEGGYFVDARFCQRIAHGARCWTAMCFWICGGMGGFPVGPVRRRLRGPLWGESRQGPALLC
jgi:hypothetical protein